MTVVALRKELKHYIEIMPEEALKALQPLLTYLAKDCQKPVVKEERKNTLLKNKPLA